MRVFKCKPGYLGEVVEVPNSAEGFAGCLGISTDELNYDYCFDDRAYCLVRADYKKGMAPNRTVEDILKYGPFFICRYHPCSTDIYLGLSDIDTHELLEKYEYVDADAYRQYMDMVAKEIKASNTPWEKILRYFKRGKN